MTPRNLVSIAAIAATALCTSVAPSPALGQEEEPMLETVPVLQGGFEYVDKRNKGDKYELNNMTQWSDGTEVLSGGRVRNSNSNSGALTCFDIAWFDGGLDKVRRTDKKLKYKQRDYVEITFVQFNCSSNPGFPTCYSFKSNTVATPKCKSGSDTNAKQTLKKGLPPVGKSKFNCTDGIEITAEAFGLPEGIQNNFLEAFPDLRQELKANFSDDAGSIVDEAAAFKNLSPTLGLPSCF